MIYESLQNTNLCIEPYFMLKRKKKYYYAPDLHLIVATRIVNKVLVL